MRTHPVTALARSVPALALIACLVVACTGDPVAQVTDLRAIVPMSDDAPDDLRYAGRLSGPADLEAFRGDPEGREAMRAAGFRSAWTSLFASPDLLAFFTLSEPNTDPPEDARLVTASAVLFADADGATSALATFEEEATDGMRDPLRGLEPVPGGFALAGARGGQPVTATGSVAGEIVVLVQTQGSVPPATADAMLAGMHDAAITETAS
ncbi:MAG: hypothetical protein WEA54_07145 [Actinomycetota bacterium]